MVNNNNNNPFQFLQMAMTQQNPQQFVLNMLKQNQQNPIFNNILQLAEQNKTEEIETIARNLFKEKGLDFDKEFNQFKQQLSMFRR